LDRLEKKSPLKDWHPKEKNQTSCNRQCEKNASERKAFDRRQTTMLQKNQVGQNQKNQPAQDISSPINSGAVQNKQKPGSIETEVFGCFPVG
jgi:hypothetical protein